MARRIFRRKNQHTIEAQTGVFVSSPGLNPKIPIHEKAKNVAHGVAPGARRLNQAVVVALVFTVLVIPLGKFLVNRFWCSYVPSVEHCAKPTTYTSTSIPS